MARRLATEEAIASVPLQICLFYNMFLSLLFFVMEACLLAYKLQEFEFVSQLYRAFVIPCFFFWSLAEPTRLFYGYSGNLTEQVPHSSAFFLITVFPQVPGVLFLTFAQEHSYPIERILGSIVLIFLFAEIYFGSSALRRLMAKQMSHFYRLQNQHDMSAQEDRVGLLADYNERGPGDQ
eukprot:CAMPEP_0118964310 /NCGR_PEP_ID=MMETSP1173-20130426/2036_1 /TAXON_ID=1034831 /ORGANISM="Rhizochromulina marina cf, Strain CCMP1243" /LENGTH=178 /DNA_ID=CAMNT_0006912751 /DNA_START=31 /DNA_END=567 /DNA_ORIENTATION=-